jgi:hypothetical protein
MQKKNELLYNALCEISILNARDKKSIFMIRLGLDPRTFSAFVSTIVNEM